MRKSRFCPFSAPPHPFFTSRTAYCFHAAFRPFEKWRTLQKKTTPLQTKRTVFRPSKEWMSGIQKRKKHPREKMHHVLAQPRAKRHTPTWTNVPEACTTDSIIYRKINSTTKGTSYPQKEPSPLGWAISPKKKKRAQKRIKTTGFQHGRGGVVRQSRPHKSPVGGEEGGTEGRERAKRWEENRQSHKKRAKRKACAEKTVNLQAN